MRGGKRCRFPPRNSFLAAYILGGLFAETHKDMGMVIIPMSIMHIIIPKRVTIMLVRLLSVTGVPVPFSMSIA